MNLIDRRLFRWCGVGALVLLSASAAEAQGEDANDEQARIHFEAGRQYYNDGHYEQALREFERSFELSGRVELFHNYSLCYERLGDFEQAYGYLERYLHEARVVEDRDAFEVRLRSLRERADRQREERDRPPPLPPERGVPVPAIATLAGAGATGVLSLTFGVMALRERADVKDDCGDAMACMPGQVDRMDRLALLSDIFLGVTVAAAATGVVLLFVLRGGDEVDQPTAQTTRLSPFVTGRGGGLVLSGAL